MPRISQPETMLTDALIELEDDWKIARAEWNDEARDRFETDFLEPIRPVLRRSVSALTELTLLYRRVIQECS